MEALKSHEFSRSGGGATKHDWAKLLDGGIYKLTQSTEAHTAEDGTEVEEVEGDYSSQTKTFAMMARKQAKVKGVGLKTETTEDGIIIQAVPLTEKAAPTPKAPAKKKK